MPYLGYGNSDIDSRYSCREQQISELKALLSHDTPRPSSIVVHGAEATGKSSVVGAILASTIIPNVIIDCKECITGRHLLERTSIECHEVVANHHDTVPKKGSARCESLSALSAQLQETLCDEEAFILMLDGVDQQREPPPTLLPALARVADQIPCLTIVFIISVPHPRLFQHPGLPHVEFPNYNRDEVLDILSHNPLEIYPPDAANDLEIESPAYSEDDQWLWVRFCAAVWDALGDAAARDIVSFRTLAERLWGPFVTPVVDGTYGPRDFSRLMVAKRALFQRDEYLTDSVIGPTAERGQIVDNSMNNSLTSMPELSIYILCAAYLASYNPTRLDPIYFMEWSEKKKKRRGGKGGGPRGRAPKYRKIPRRALPPAPFPLARLHAILSAIYPHPLPAAMATDILTSIASMTACRLTLRAGAGGLGGDALEEGAKWKVNVGWEHVVKLGRSVGLEMQEWSAE